MTQTLNDIHLPYTETSLTFTYFTQKSYLILKIFLVITDKVIKTKTLKNASKIINLTTYANKHFHLPYTKNLSPTLHGRNFMVEPFKL